MVKNPQLSVFEVFYDGDCPLCNKEIALIRWMDRKSKRLVLTDIAAPSFSTTSLDKSLDELHREIHGRDASGNWVTGVEVFREIYSRVGFVRLTKLSKIPVLSHLLDAGYNIFAKIRYRSAMKRLAANDCTVQCSPFARSLQGPLGDKK